MSSKTERKPQVEGTPQAGEPYKGMVIGIVPAYQIGADGNFPVARIVTEKSEFPSQLPLPEDHGFSVGDKVTITPVFTPVGTRGGGHTTFQIELDRPQN